MRTEVETDPSAKTGRPATPTTMKARYSTAQFPDGPPGPWQRKRIRMSLEIERTGLQLIAAHGLDDVTVEQVAAAAGISTRTFFRYFRNVPDLLTAVPRRQVERMCQFVLERPAHEGPLEAFRAVYESLGAAQIGTDRTDLTDNDDLKEAALQLWGEIVRADAERVSAASHVQRVMTVGFESVIRTRLGLDDDMTPGILASALAGLIWFVYVHWIENGAVGSLQAQLHEAFERMSSFFERPGPMAMVSQELPHVVG